MPESAIGIYLVAVMHPQTTATDCPVQPVELSKIGKRKITAECDGGRMSSNAGALALREVEAKCQILDRIAACFTDHRDPSRVEHSLNRLLGQCIFGLCMGYEDLNDHDRLRDDPILRPAVGCEDIEGDERVRDRDKGHALASSEMLNRLELPVKGTVATDRYYGEWGYSGMVRNGSMAGLGFRCVRHLGVHMLVRCGSRSGHGRYIRQTAGWTWRWAKAPNLAGAAYYVRMWE